MAVPLLAPTGPQPSGGAGGTGPTGVAPPGPPPTPIQVTNGQVTSVNQPGSNYTANPAPALPVQGNNTISVPISKANQQIIAQHAVDPTTPVDPNLIANNSSSEAEIHAVYDQLAGNINNTYQTGLNTINGQYGAGVAGINQQGTQSHQQLGLYGQQETQQNAADQQGINNGWNYVRNVGNQAVNSPLAGALKGMSAEDRAMYGRQMAMYESGIGLDQGAANALSKQYGQIAGMNNTNAQQDASLIQQGGLTDLHNTDLQALYGLTNARDTALNNANLDQLKEQLAANNSSNSLDNNLAEYLFKQQYTAAHPTATTVKTLQGVAKGAQAPTPPALSATLLGTNASGATPIDAATYGTLSKMRGQLASGGNPNQILTNYMSSGTPNDYVVNYLQNYIPLWNQWHAING